MDSSEFGKLAGMMAKIAYELHDHKEVNPHLKELLLELWREFDHYNHEWRWE